VKNEVEKERKTQRKEVDGRSVLAFILSFFLSFFFWLFALFSTGLSVF
jgi:hypothetical protein